LPLPVKRNRRRAAAMTGSARNRISLRHSIWRRGYYPHSGLVLSLAASENIFIKFFPEWHAPFSSIDAVAFGVL